MPRQSTAIRPVFSASSILEQIATDLARIKFEDRLTYADIGAVLGKSDDQATKYCDGSAEMGIIAFARGKREWNGRFTGSLDRLCVDSRPAALAGRAVESHVLKAALALSIALEDDNEIDDAEVKANRAAITMARDALDGLLRRAG